MQGRFAGIHVIVEFEQVPGGPLDDEPFLKSLLEGAMTEAGATVLTVVSQRFDPQGVTVLALLAESHASLHTYPEYGAAFVDVFTCGESADPKKAVALLSEGLRPGRVTTRIIDRGAAQ